MIRSFKPVETDYSTINGLHVDINSLNVSFNCHDLTRLMRDHLNKEEKFTFEYPFLLRFKFVEDSNNYYYIQCDPNNIEGLLKYNFIKQDKKILDIIYTNELYVKVTTAESLNEDILNGIHCSHWSEAGLHICDGAIVKKQPIDSETFDLFFEVENIVDEKDAYDRLLNRFIILKDESFEGLDDPREKESFNTQWVKSYKEEILGCVESDDMEDNQDDNKDSVQEDIQQDSIIPETSPIFTRIKKVIYSNDISIKDEKIRCLLLIYNDDSIAYIYLNNELTADLYYRCKYHNIEFVYGSDEEFLNNIIDFYYDAEREINLSYYKEKLQNMVANDDFSKIEELKLEGNNLLIDELKDKDPVLLMMKSAEEYKKAVEQFQKKYKEVISSNEELKIPEGYASPEEFQEKDPEGFKAYTDKLDQHTKKEKAELELASMKYQTSQNFNKQFLLETQMSISFDSTKKKTERFLENAIKNNNETGIKLYKWMLDRYEESITLEPLFTYFNSKKYEPGKFSHTFYMNYDKVVKRVRKKLQDEKDYRFIDPVIIISRIKQLIEKYPDKFEGYESPYYPFMVYYLFIKLIDSEKKDYLRQNGLFIIRFIQHLALYFNDYYLFSEREILVNSIVRVMEHIKKDIIDPEGNKKYKNSYYNKTIPFINKKETELEEFLKKEKERIRQERLLKKLTLLSLAEEGNNPITEEIEETE